MNARQNTHDNNFALLHILGAMFVICGHSYVLLGKAAPMLMGVSVHTFGVEILFAISGFLVTQSYMRKRQLLIFYRNRIARILPPLAACLILTLFWGAFISSERTELYLQGAWTCFWHNILMFPYFYVPGLFADLAVPNALNGSLWTLPIELSCYLLLPLIVLCCGRSGRRQSCIPPAVIFSLALASPIKSKFSNSHDYAYGLYLYAFPVQQTLIWELSYRRGISCEPLVLLFASTAITLVLAALSYYLIEKPTTRLLARIYMK